MFNELNILINIYNDLMINIEHIKNSRLRLLKIKKSINSLNNNFFKINCNDDLFYNYLHMFDDSVGYLDLLTNLETLKTQTEYHLKNKCEHEWIFDDIDIDPDSSQRICYCIKCEVTKK